KSDAAPVLRWSVAPAERRMTGSDARASTWTCPGCGRHVPPRIDRCRCGHERAASPSIDPVLPDRPSDVTNRRATALVVIGIAVGIGLLALVEALYWVKPRSEPSQLASARATPSTIEPAAVPAEQPAANPDRPEPRREPDPAPLEPPPAAAP